MIATWVTMEWWFIFLIAFVWLAGGIVVWAAIKSRECPEIKKSGKCCCCKECVEQKNCSVFLNEHYRLRY